MLIDQLLPDYDHHERHSRWVAAPPERVWELLYEMKVAELRTSMRLMRLRGGPAAWRGDLEEKAAGMRAIDAFAPRELVSDPPRELVLGDIARYTAAKPERPPVKRGDAEAFAAFAEEGWSKVAMNFHLRAQDEGTLVHTETRVLTHGASAKRAFALYWLLVRAGSGLIRRDLLKAIERLATG